MKTARLVNATDLQIGEPLELRMKDEECERIVVEIDFLLLLKLKQDTNAIDDNEDAGMRSVRRGSKFLWLCLWLFQLHRDFR